MNAPLISPSRRDYEDQPRAAILREELPLDFAEYVGRRLNLTRDQALTALGKCLIEYQPAGVYEIDLLVGDCD
jgi:hypothetical protein